MVKVVKYHAFKRIKTFASITLPAKNTIQCFIPLKRFIKISLFQCLSPNSLKTDVIVCNNFILWTLFLEIKQNRNVHICSVKMPARKI